jgi:DNA-binding response OmpR family regulator
MEEEWPMVDSIGTNGVSLPCLVLAHPNPDNASRMAREFRRRGWDVYLTRSGPEARQLIRMLEADAAILHADLCEESGWLTCDKLTREQPLARVVLVSDERSARNEELAVFVGARAFVQGSESLVPVVEELMGAAV